MRLTITILCGTRAGQRFVVALGETVCFGRTAKADVVLADDPTMSAVHFELECAENVVLVRDLHSRNRSFLNGEPVTEAVLADGDQLRAGRTYFSISITDPLAPTGGPSAADETTAPGPLDATHAERRAPVSMTAPLGEPPPAAALIPAELLGRSNTEARASHGLAMDYSPVVDRQGAVDRLYMIVDGEGGAPFVEEARRANRRAASLAFAGFSADQGQVAAFLVEVPHDRASVHGWRSRDGASAILIESPADFDELLSHLRGTFGRDDGENRFGLSRRYEPHLIYQWLARCDRRELADFFGGLSSIILDLRPGGRLLRLTQVGGQLREEDASFPNV